MDPIMEYGEFSPERNVVLLVSINKVIGNIWMDTPLANMDITSVGTPEKYDLIVRGIYEDAVLLVKQDELAFAHGITTFHVDNPCLQRLSGYPIHASQIRLIIIRIALLLHNHFIERGIFQRAYNPFLYNMRGDTLMILFTKI